MPFRKFHFGSRLRRLKRYRHIVAVLTKYGFEEAADAIHSRFAVRIAGGKTAGQAQQVPKNHSRPRRARMVLEELGPTFIKFGQLLSTRPDLLGAEYIKELETLQDQVAPDDAGKICDEIENRLGQSLDKIFKSFERTPVAAGSIAQVHRGVTHDGKTVAVKVRRPGIVETIQTECEILEDLAGLLKASLFRDAAINPQKIVREFIEAVSVEVDLDNERHNQMRFFQSFADNPAIHVPAVYEEYSCRSVLTMEFINGIKPGDKEGIRQHGIDPKLIAQRGADYILKQIFEIGFFHADPHPGNFFLMDGNILAPLDFGQVAYLSSHDRKLFNKLVIAIVDNESGPMIDMLEREEMISEQTNMDQLIRDAELLLGSYHNLPLKEIPFSKLISEIFDLIRRHRVNPPARFTLMLKSLVTIESFALSMDPDFNIIEHLKPYARKLRLSDISPGKILKDARKAIYSAGGLASRLPEDMDSILKKFRQGKFQLRIHHEHLDNLVKTLDKSSDRISFALIIAALLISSSMLVAQNGSVLGLISLQSLGVIGYIAAAIIGIWLLLSIIHSRRL